MVLPVQIQGGPKHRYFIRYNSASFQYTLKLFSPKYSGDWRGKCIRSTSRLITCFCRIFIACQHAMHAECYYFNSSVRLSVRPSNAGIVSKRLNVSKNFFWPSGSPIILVFFLLRALIPNSKGNPVSRGAKFTGVGKFCDFRLKSPFISETVRDRPMVTVER